METFLQHQQLNRNMSNEEAHPAAKSVTTALRLFSALAGAVLGTAALLFYAGFVIQRAQFDIAGVPFVFVDYWAYVEVGVGGVTRSCVLLLESWPWLVSFFGLSIAIVFGLEWERFRDFLAKPHWLFAAALIHLCVVGVLVRQQLAISGLRHPGQSALAGRRAEQRELARLIPARWPFQASLAKSQPSPEFLYSEFHRYSAEDLWERIADELEYRMVERQYLEVRPAPLYATSHSFSTNPVPSLFGAHARPKGEASASDQERAQELYCNMLTWGAFAVWSFILLGVWERQMRLRFLPEAASYQGIGTREPDQDSEVVVTDRASSAGNRRPLLERLREEMWWVVRYLALPLNGLALLFAVVVLMPESYGALAMPRLGEEMVEVIIERTTSGGAEDRSKLEREKTANGSDGTDSLSHIERYSIDAGAEESFGLPQARAEKQALQDADLTRSLLGRLSELADSYVLADVEEQSEHGDRWRTEIDMIAAIGTSRALEFLNQASEMTRHYAPELANIAAGAATKMRGDVASSLKGYILYYPRSAEEKRLKLLTRSTRTEGSWEFVPIDLDAIKELRVVRDEQTRRVISMLRRMRSLSPDQVNRLLVEAELEGHWSLLEISLAAMWAESSEVVGPAITSALRFSANLDDSTWGRLRRARAIEVLLAYFADATKPPHLRGAAATSLAGMTRIGDTERVGGALLHSLTNETRKLVDPDWQTSGTVVSALGRIKYREAVPALLLMVADTNTPVPIRGAIPTALISIDDKPRTIPALTNLLFNPETPHQVTGTTVTALGYLGKGASNDVPEILHQYCRLALTNRSFGLQSEQLDTLLGATVSAMVQTENRSAVLPLQDIVENRQEYLVRGAESAVGAAAVGLSRVPAASSEVVLLELAEDESVSLELRVVAIRALRGFKDDQTVQRLYDLYMSSRSLRIDVSIVETLRRRAELGSGLAKRLLERILEERRSISTTGLDRLLQQLQERLGEESPGVPSPGNDLERIE